MSETLSSGTISQELYAYGDTIWDDQDITGGSAINSSVFMIGKTANALELVMTVGTTALAMAASTGSLAITITFSSSATTGFGDSETLYTLAAEGTAAAGTEIVRYAVPSDKAVYAKITATSGAAADAGSLNAVIASVRK